MRLDFQMQSKLETKIVWLYLSFDAEIESGFIEDDDVDC